MRPYQLKRNILYKAIQGTLVNQDAGEGTGVELINKNKSLVANMLVDTKKRIGKNCKSITEEDKLFDIPDSWGWERFGNLVINYDM